MAVMLWLHHYYLALTPLIQMNNLSGNFSLPLTSNETSHAGIKLVFATLTLPVLPNHEVTTQTAGSLVGHYLPSFFYYLLWFQRHKSFVSVCFKAYLWYIVTDEDIPYYLLSRISVASQRKLAAVCACMTQSELAQSLKASSACCLLPLQLHPHSLFASLSPLGFSQRQRPPEELLRCDQRSEEDCRGWFQDGQIGPCCRRSGSFATTFALCHCNFLSL